jgi:predicted metal-dependent hydrolase
MAELGVVRVGDALIEYEVVRSRRRRRTIEISLDAQQRVRVAVPLRTRPDEVRDVVERRAGWIERRRLEAPPAPHLDLMTGECLPYLGRLVRLIVERTERKRATARLDDGLLRVALPRRVPDEERRAATERALVKWYRGAAAEHLDGRVERWAAAGGRAPVRVLVRDQRHRWGSCAPDGTLRFNWRIVMAPPQVVDYVVVHELAHLRVPNHSSMFWGEVERVLPEYREARAVLKQVGPSLIL